MVATSYWGGRTGPLAQGLGHWLRAFGDWDCLMLYFTVFDVRNQKSLPSFDEAIDQ